MQAAIELRDYNLAKRMSQKALNLCPNNLDLVKQKMNLLKLLGKSGQS